MNVMLIDDDQICLDSLKSALLLNGFGVKCFGDPRQALYAYDPRSTDAVITDYSLPGMTGAELLREIHRRKIDTPVLIISGETDKSVKALSLRAGAEAFYPKPVNIKAIIAKLKACGRR